MEMSIVIPAYNEEKRLPKTISEIEKYFNKKNSEFEIIVIDDGSIDKTAEYVMKKNRNNPKIKLFKNGNNFGKGYSVRKGIMNSQGRYILVTDSDLSTPINQVDDFLVNIGEEFDIIIGSRGLKDSKIIVHQFILREAMGRIFNFLVRFLIGLSFKDTQCGFKLFKSSVAKSIFEKQKINSFAFDVEVLTIALKNKARILEFPVIWSNNSSTKVNVIQHPIEMFIDLFKIYLKYVLNQKSD